MSQQLTIRFHNNSAFTGLTGVVDRNECVIRGVSVIKGGCVAEGHDLSVDNDTVTQLHELARAKGKVPVILDHGSGVKDLNGYIDNFRLDGGKLRGDWHLLKSHDETPKMLERAETMPTCFGLSVAFKGKGVVVPGSTVKAARAEKLLSVDCVTRPAANDEGLFAAKDTQVVDIPKKNMPEDNQTQAAEPNLTDVMGLLTKLNERLDAQEKAQQEIIEHLNSQTSGEDNQIDPDLLEQLYNSDDAKLKELGLTREEVDAAVAEYNASIDAGEQGQTQEGQGQNGQHAQGGQEAAPAGAGAGAAGGAEGSAPATFSALQAQVIALRKEIDNDKRRAQAQAEEVQFQEVETKITKLAAQRDQLLQFADQLVAENEALRLAVKTGTRPVKAGVDNGVRLFSANQDGELHEFQKLVKAIESDRKVSKGQAIQLAIKENPALHVDWLQSQPQLTVRS
jgi:hypothetical protein